MSTHILAGRYELIEKIGTGGMAVVYKARCKFLNRFVAIKILKPEFTKDNQFIESFRRESQAAAGLNHPNIVGVYDVGREGNIHYIVMELIEGAPLSDIIKERGPIPYEEAIKITKEVAMALGLAHSRHIVHRDVKPHNIMITDTGIAKITDFGIAKAISNSTLVGSTNTIMGSVHYFSPEQARGGYVDEKSDIYSLGIVLYEMLTAKVPFDGENPVSVALMHMNDPMTPPSSLVEGIPPRLEQIVMKATDKVQINRYKSAEELVKALYDLEFVTRIVGTSSLAGTGYSSPRSSVSGEGKPDEVKESEEVNNGNRGGSAKGGKVGKDGKPLRKLRINKVKIIAALCALVLAIPVSGFITNFIQGGFPASAITVPDFTGMRIEEAKERALTLKLEVVQGDMVISSQPEGRIVSQKPEAGASVKAGKSITVSVSKGGQSGTVPKLDGSSQADAEMILKKYGYKVGSITSEASALPKGYVVRQSPKAGEQAPAGASISLVLSTGASEDQVEMPDLVGKKLESAKKILEDAGLELGGVTFEAGTGKAENEIIAQEFEAATAVTKGTKVALTVAGSKDVQASQVIPLTISYSLADKQVFYLTVTVSDEAGTTNLMTNQQRLKEDGYEVVSLTGSGQGTVTVIIDNNVVMKKNVNFTTGEID